MIFYARDTLEDPGTEEVPGYLTEIFDNAKHLRRFAPDVDPAEINRFLAY